MIGQRRDAGLGQRCRGILDLGARQAIDDTGVACVALGDEGLELRRRVLLVDDFVADIRAVETRDKARRASEAKPVDDLLAGEVVGSGGQRDARHVGETLGYHRQADIFRTEVVPPLRHAMRFVDRKQSDARAAEQSEAARRQQPLRRDIEQVKIAREQPRLDLGGFVERQRGIQHRRLDAGLEQARDLVAHQRDQRRDHDAAALAQEGRQLIAQRLAAAGRHQHQAIAAVRDDALTIASCSPRKAGKPNTEFSTARALGARSDLRLWRWRRRREQTCEFCRPMRAFSGACIPHQREEYASKQENRA